MREFANLFYELEQTDSPNGQVELILRYLQSAPDEDKIWMLALFTGRKPKRITTTNVQREWAAEASGFPEWLVEECFNAVGDLPETISLLLPEAPEGIARSLSYWIRYLSSLEGSSDEERKESVMHAWSQMSKKEIFVFNKIASSTMKIAVSQNILVKALSLYTGINSAVLMHRLMNKWNADEFSFNEFIGEGEEEIKNDSVPYPFFLASPLQEDTSSLGIPTEWLAEWKWDGIRVQVIKRSGELFIWSRGEELITDKLPEFKILKEILPDGTVIDAELLAYKDGKILPFNLLQNRVAKKNINGKIMSEVPAILFAFDLLENEGKDIREEALEKRRKQLENLVSNFNIPQLQISSKVEFDSWDQLSGLRLQSRAHFAEGLMLKRNSSAYKEGRIKGDWWKWKTDPFTIDAVLIYVQTGAGMRANIYSELTFGVWQNKELITFAKANQGLTEKELLEVDAWVRQNSMEKFGPVRTVKPALVFEIGFEGIQESNRHKSGIALRVPRILRWRKDKKIEEADTLDTLKGILKSIR